MKVEAPGKLLLAGAYAVLDGFPALVVAIDRYVVADGDVRGSPATAEVLAAMSSDEAPGIDASALRDGAFKLGLGSSAAILVASLGVRAARNGEDLEAPAVRRGIFSAARRAHGQVQSGGSGVDVAASVYGGSLEYTIDGAGSARVAPVDLPAQILLDVFWSGTPATTTEMRARVAALGERDPRCHRACIEAVGKASGVAIHAARQGDSRAFLVAAIEGCRALAELGNASDAPIFPANAQTLAAAAESDGGAFLPSGAGGGDVFVHVSTAPVSPRFLELAAAVGMRRLTMRVDARGVRLV